MEPDGLPNEWVDAFRETSAAVPDVDQIVRKAAEDAVRTRFERTIVIGGLCVGASVNGLGLAFGRTTGSLSVLLVVLLALHVLALVYVVSLGARARATASASVAEHVAAAMSRSRWRHRSLWAVVVMHFVVIGLVATMLLPYVAGRFGVTGPRFFGALAALVPIFATGTYVLVRQLRRGRLELAEWTAIAQSLGE
jgi:NADH:ubiquinone oxidoreductase subunit 3 (subunit A)